MLIWALIKWLFTTITGWLVISLITGIILTIVGINKEIKKCKAKKVKKDLEQEYAEHNSAIDVIPTTKAYSDYDAYISDTNNLHLGDRFCAQLNMAASENKTKSHNPEIITSNIHKLRRSLSDYVVVDTETTGLSVHSDFVIQLSALKYKEDKLVGQYNQLINPDIDSLDHKITELTGITIEDLKGKPKFGDVKDDFLAFVGDLPWVGYNINQFDIPILMSNGLGVTNFYTEDAYLLAKRRMPSDIPNRKLSTLKLYFGINAVSHNALEDCRTTAIVYQHLRDNDIAPAQNNFLVGKNFATVGKIADKKYISYFIELYGGEVKKSISHKVNYLIKGEVDHLTKTEERARAYGIPIISYSQVMELIEKGKVIS